MDYKTALEKRNLTWSQEASRPEQVTDLLLYPISDDPLSDPSCYSQWEMHHANKQRFYVGGWAWLVKETNGIFTSTSVGRFGSDAPIHVEQNTNWAEQLIHSEQWKQAAARKKFNRALGEHPLAVQFHKAVMIIVACELALERYLASGKTCKTISNPLEIYRHMAVVPACWNIDNFQLAVLRSIGEGVNGTEKVSAALKHNGEGVLEDLEQGHTVGWETASSISHLISSEKNSLAEQYPTLREPRVRVTPGTKVLGRKDASEHEVANLG